MPTLFLRPRFVQPRRRRLVPFTLPPSATGSLTATLGSVTLAGVADAEAPASSTADLTVTLGSITLTGAGTASGAGASTGVLTGILDAITLAGVADAEAPASSTADLTVTLGSITLAGVADAEAPASSNATLDVILGSVTIVGDGTSSAVGASAGILTVTLGSITLAGVADAEAPVSTYTLEGPSTATVDRRSCAFTVELGEGAVTGTIRISFSDNGAGGTFSPTAYRDLTETVRSKQFTYIPATAGDITISVTNDGGLTDPDPIVLAVAAAVPSADVMNRAMSWLRDMKRVHESVEITYWRMSDSVEVNATLGSKLLNLSDQADIRVEVQDLDFIIPADELVLDGVPVTPEKGDRIFLPIGSEVQKFEVFPLGTEPPWRWCDPFHHQLRVHCKHVATEEGEEPDESDISNVMDEALEWLRDMKRTHQSVPVTYARSFDSVEINATLGRILLNLTDQPDIRVESQDMDFLLPAEELVLAGNPTTPEKGDRIFLPIGCEVQKFEVFPLGTEPPWRWCDPYHHMIRVHSKYVGSEAID